MSAIDDLLKDPKFRKLMSSAPDRARAIVSEMSQRDFNNIPNSDNFLEKAIGTAKAIGKDALIGITSAENTATMGAYGEATQAMSKIGNIIGDVAGFPNTPEIESGNFGMVKPSTDPGQGLGGAMNMVMNPAKYHENWAEGIGNTLGFIGGGPGKLMGMAEKGVAKGIGKSLPNFLTKAIGRSAGGAVGGASVPGSFEERVGNAELGAILGPAIGAGIDLGGSAVKSGAKFLNVLRGKGIKELEQVIGKTQGNINQTTQEAQALKSETSRLGGISSYLEKRSKRELGRSAKEMGASSESNIKKSIGENFLKAKENYRKMIQESDPEGVNLGDLYDVLDRAVTNKGIGKVVDPNTQTLILDPSERALLSLRSELASKLPKEGVSEGIVDLANPKNVMRIADIKNFKNRIISAVKNRPDIEAEFMGQHAEMLKSKGLEGMNDANQLYREAYSKLKASKPLKSNSLTSAIEGKLPKTKLEELFKAEKSSGVNELENIIKKQSKKKLGYTKAISDVKRYQKSVGNIASDSDIASKLMADRLKSLESDLSKKKLNSLLAKVGAGSAIASLVGAGGIFNLGKKFNDVINP